MELLVQEVWVCDMDFELKRVEEVDHLGSQGTLRLPFHETRLVYVS